MAGIAHTFENGIMYTVESIPSLPESRQMPGALKKVWTYYCIIQKYPLRRGFHLLRPRRLDDLEPRGHSCSHPMPPLQDCGKVSALVPRIEVFVFVGVAVHPRIGHDADVGLALQRLPQDLCRVSPNYAWRKRRKKGTGGRGLLQRNDLSGDCQLSARNH